VTRALHRLALGLRLRLLLALLLVSVAGCRGQEPRTAADALTGAQAVYSLGCVALEVADAASVAWLAGLEQPTEADIARGEELVAALELAHAALVRARAALVAGQDALSDVKEALAVLRLAASLLGAQAPPGLATALDGADRVLGRDP
jgi:hypothetical protein